MKSKPRTKEMPKKKKKKKVISMGNISHTADCDTKINKR